MLARIFVVLSFGMGAVACASIPELTFVPDDAAVEGGQGDAVDAEAPRDATTADAELPPPPPDATSDALLREAGPVDGASLTDAPAQSGDSAPSCPPPGAPAATLCCSTDAPCIGQACAHCNECNCALGLYCCANENGGGKFQGTNCSSAPTGPQCPAQ